MEFGDSPTPAYRRWAVAVLIAAALVSGIGAAYPQNTWLQVGPVVLFAAALPRLMQRWTLSRISWNFILAFVLLHLFAAHWTYSDVPYADWLERIGVDSAQLFGSSRNMFDRLVHFCFGLLAVRPIVEIESVHGGVGRRLAYRLSILLVLASSAAYEIFEWTIAIMVSPEAADAYNGQQGDMFDAQKDMWMAFAGAIVGLIALHRRYRRWKNA